MNHPAFRAGFRVVGGPTGERIAVDAALAFSAHAATDPTAQCDHECYLSAFTFDPDDADFKRRTGPGSRVDTRGYNGSCFAPWLWFDIDRGDLPTALHDCRRLVGGILNEFTALDERELLVFYSGSKGFHVGIPSSTTGAVPSAVFHHHARSFATALAGKAGVTIDAAVYDRVRLFRAPNSLHPKTGRYKRYLSHDELTHLSADRILQLASSPSPFDVPPPPASIPAVVAAWDAAAPAPAPHAITREGTGPRPPGRVQRATLEFIRGNDQPDEGQRNVRLWRAASNLLELRTPLPVVRDLLTGPARDSGLTPTEIETTLASAAGGIAARQKGGAA